MDRIDLALDLKAVQQPDLWIAVALDPPARGSALASS